MDPNPEQGKSSGVPKWGYNRSEITGFYEPNENFYYIQEGWKMNQEKFLNWEIGQQNRVFYRYKDPIELVHKYIKSTFGARDWTRTSTLLAYAPKAYVSTNSTTRARCNRIISQVIVPEYYL